MKQRRNNAYHIFVAQTPLVQQPVGDPLEMGLDHRMSMGIALEYIVSRQHRYTVHGITMPSPLALQTQLLPIQTSSKNRHAANAEPLRASLDEDPKISQMRR